MPETNEPTARAAQATPLGRLVAKWRNYGTSWTQESDRLFKAKSGYAKVEIASAHSAVWRQAADELEAAIPGVPDAEAAAEAWLRAQGRTDATLPQYLPSLAAAFRDFGAQARIVERQTWVERIEEHASLFDDDDLRPGESAVIANGLRELAGVKPPSSSHESGG